MLLRQSSPGHAPTLFARFVAYAVVLGSWSPALAAEQTDATARTELVSEQQINDWIKQLDANRYDRRELAQRQLVTQGLTSLTRVTTAAQTGSLESSTRALNILLAWSDSADAELRIAALEKIAELPNRPKEARIAAGLINDAREQVALQNIARLGGYYGKDRQIHGIDNLQIVIGKNWTGGTKGLAHLAHIPRATTISFHSVALPDTALQELPQLKNVQRFELYGTDFSAEAVKQLDEALPSNVAVVPRGGALLGIRGNVIEVEPKSAAFRAGIRPGDLITQIEGDDVADFDALTERIGKHKPGDTVQLTVQRGKQVSTVEVTFGEWGEQQLTNRRPVSSRTTPVLMPKKIYIERR